MLGGALRSGVTHLVRCNSAAKNNPLHTPVSFRFSFVYNQGLWLQVLRTFLHLFSSVFCENVLWLVDNNVLKDREVTLPCS